MIEKTKLDLIIEQLLSGNCSAVLYIDLSGPSYRDGEMCIDTEGVKAIAKALESGNCPAGLNWVLTT